MAKSGKRVEVHIYQISYFERTKRRFDVLILPKNALPYTARDYHEHIKLSGVKVNSMGRCGVGWAVLGGGGDREYDISTYREI